jgi:hypothetical protein
VCCGDLLSVEISNGTVITCSSELYAKVVNKSNMQSKTLSRVSPYYMTIIKTFFGLNIYIYIVDMIFPYFLIICCLYLSALILASVTWIINE